MKTTNQENKTYSYWRNPQKEEIKLGYGAIHFRDFDKELCFNEDGTFKLALITKDDRLKYYSCNYEYFITSKYKIRRKNVGEKK